MEKTAGQGTHAYRAISAESRAGLAGTGLFHEFRRAVDERVLPSENPEGPRVAIAAGNRGRAYTRVRIQGQGFPAQRPGGSDGGGHETRHIAGGVQAYGSGLSDGEGRDCRTLSRFARRF